MVYCYPEAIFIFHFSNFLQVFYQNLFKQSTTQTSNLNATFGFKMKLAKVKNDTKTNTNKVRETQIPRANRGRNCGTREAVEAS